MAAGHGQSPYCSPVRSRTRFTVIGAGRSPVSRPSWLVNLLGVSRHPIPNQPYTAINRLTFWADLFSRLDKQIGP